MPKLAEALVERKGLHERFGRLCIRLATNAKVQEGDQPAEPPDALLAEAGRVLAEMKRLTIEINRTNSEAKLPGSTGTNGVDSGSLTLMEAIAERDRLRSELQMLTQLSGAARVEGHNYTRNEIKWRSTVDIAAIQQQIDRLSQNYRLLDTQIQEANWLTELIQN